MTQGNSNNTTDVESVNTDTAASNQGPRLFARSMHIRIAIAVYGILGLIACHFTILYYYSIRSPASVLSQELQFVLSLDCGWPIFPFLFFSMTCLGIVIRNASWALSKPWVRFGIFSGPIVCCWYMVAFSWTSMNTPWVLSALFIGAIIWLFVVHEIIGYLIGLSQRSNSIHLAEKFAIGAILIAAVALPRHLKSELLTLPFHILLTLATPLAFLTYLGVSICTLELHSITRRITMAQLMTWVTWLTAFAAAIRTTIELSVAKHALFLLP